MHLAQKVDHESWIQEVQHLLLVPKIYITAIIGDISQDCNAIWRKNLDTNSPAHNVKPIVYSIVSSMCTEYTDVDCNLPRQM